ncbi:MAG TPA: phosphatidylglycerophosphatase A [Candidatus Omnitrophota bacterium]|nr:phosphatidylglycerophosphatase A [Candidatus Omnitrophota bacterium]
MAKQKINTQPLIRLVSTFFFFGSVPFAPGTVASLAGVFLYAGILNSFIKWAIAFSIIGIAGFLTAGRYAGKLGKRDPAEIVIDEVWGVLMVFIGVPLDMGLFITGFLLFRFFDIVKPFPVNKLEKIPGSLGIMFDDLMAGIYANIALRAFVTFSVAR